MHFETETFDPTPIRCRCCNDDHSNFANEDDICCTCEDAGCYVTVSGDWECIVNVDVDSVVLPIPANRIGGR